MIHSCVFFVCLFSDFCSWVPCLSWTVKLSAVLQKKTFYNLHYWYPISCPKDFFWGGVEGFQLQWPGWGMRPRSWRPPAMASRAPSSTMASKLSVLSWRPRPVSLSVSVLSHSRALPLPCGTVMELYLSCVVCLPPHVSLYGYIPVLVKFDYDFIQLYFINYLVSSCVFKFLSVQLSLVWSTHYIRCSCVSTLPCLALPCLY